MVRPYDRSRLVRRPSSLASAALSPNSLPPSRLGSTPTARSRRRWLLNAAGRWNPPAVSPTSRTGVRPLGSRVKLNVVEIAAWGRGHPGDRDGGGEAGPFVAREAGVESHGRGREADPAATPPTAPTPPTPPAGRAQRERVVQVERVTRRRGEREIALRRAPGVGAGD